MGHNFSPDRARDWANFIRRVELYLEARGLMRVFTPTLVVNPGMEPELSAFRTQWRFGSQQVTFYLPTSPELHLKRLLTQGFTQIYEIKTCFRNDELSEFHEAEFHMLEWYRTNADLSAIQTDLIGLIHEFLPGQKIELKTMSDLFAKYVGVQLTPDTTRDELRGTCRALGLHTGAVDSFNELFHFLFVEKVEPSLKDYPALIITDYPASQAALAKINERGFADRMELYLGGIEIANAFNELTDANLNRTRLEADLTERKARGKEALPIDENFMRAMQAGLPPSGGIALGLDRLFMSIYGLKTIQETRAFPMRDVMKGFDQ